MLRFALSNKAVPRAAGQAAARQMAVAGTSHGSDQVSDIQQERWVDTGIDYTSGEPDFSDPITVGELEQSRALLEASFQSSSSSATDDHVDPDEQILHLHSNMTVQRQPQVLADSSMWHAAAAMASSASVQKACFDSLKNDPEVYTAMAALFENHGFQLQAIDPTHTGRLALEDGAAEIASHSVTPDPEGSAQPLRALFERVNTVFQNLGDSISDYLARMQRRLHNLVLRLQGAPVATGAKEGESADGASSAPQRDSNLLMDITITMATGLLLVALAGRLGGARMPFAMRR